MPQHGLPDDVTDARRRGAELQAGLPKPRWNHRQLKRAETWGFLIAPLAAPWLLVLVRPSSTAVAVASIGSLTIGPLMWLRVKGGFYRGTRW